MLKGVGEWCSLEQFLLGRRDARWRNSLTLLISLYDMHICRNEKSHKIRACRWDLSFWVGRLLSQKTVLDHPQQCFSLACLWQSFHWLTSLSGSCFCGVCYPILLSAYRMIHLRFSCFLLTNICKTSMYVPGMWHLSEMSNEQSSSKFGIYRKFSWRASSKYLTVPGTR